MKIFVTGADGFLGSNLVRELVDRGYKVRGLVEPESKNGSLNGLDIEIRRADILDPQKVKDALKGCSSVIHTAAVTATWPSRSEIVKKVNIQGTRNIIDAVKENGVERLVYVGSANSFGFGPKANPGDETRPYSAFKYGLDYFNSKYQAQSMVLEEVRENGLKAVIVNPTFLVGPYDAKPGFGVIILAIYMGRMPGCAPGGRNYIHVRDAAVGIVNAYEKGRVGDCYILGNRNLSYRELFDMIADETGAKAPKFNYPRLLVKIYGLFGSVIGTIAKKKNVVSFTLAKIACDEHYYSVKKAVEELNLPQTSIQTAIRDAFEWFKQNGYLDKSLV
jgi:dihydroflavonol-4-reductase